LQMNKSSFMAIFGVHLNTVLYFIWINEAPHPETFPPFCS
jgi:hypothetical protein